MADFSEPRPQRRLEGPHRQAHPQRHQHRHRRLRPRPGDGLRGAAGTTATARMTFRFVSNVDGTDFAEATRDLDPAETLFIVSSKTFTTLETMTNAHSARDWSLAGPRRRREGRGQALRRRLDQRRRRWPSSASTPPTCSGSGTGSAGATRWTRRSASRRCSPSARSNFRAMLDGFHQMDEHFRTAPFERNLPVLMGLLAVWYTDFFGAADRRRAAVRAIPEALPGLSAAVDDGEQRQARHARRDARSTYETGPIYWGEPGTNGQHSFYQLIHQGTRLIPCDFIALRPAAQPARPAPRHAAGERLRPDRGAGLRQDAASRSRPRARRTGSCRTASSRATARRTRSSPSGSRRKRSASSSPSTSTASSPRAPSGTSTRSTSGASSWARCWPSASSRSSRAKTEPALGHDSSTNNLIRRYRKRKDAGR